MSMTIYYKFIVKHIIRLPSTPQRAIRARKLKKIAIAETIVYAGAETLALHFIILPAIYPAVWLTLPLLMPSSVAMLLHAYIKINIGENTWLVSKWCPVKHLAELKLLSLEATGNLAVVIAALVEGKPYATGLTAAETQSDQLDVDIAESQQRKVENDIRRSCAHCFVRDKAFKLQPCNHMVCVQCCNDSAHHCVKCGAAVISTQQMLFAAA
eukprot:4424-Heterococcus_DN1.PRE.1